MKKVLEGERKVTQRCIKKRYAFKKSIKEPKTNPVKDFVKRSWGREHEEYDSNQQRRDYAQHLDDHKIDINDLFKVKKEQGSGNLVRMGNASWKVQLGYVGS